MKSSRIVLALAFLVLQGTAQQLPPEPPTIPERVAREGSIKIVHQSDALPKSAQELVNRADLILVGRIVSKASLLSMDQRAVVTDETVQVEDVLYSKNRSVHTGEKIALRHLGGVVSIGSARVEEVDEELPTLVEGQLYLVLARKHADAYYLISAGTVAFTDDTSRCVAKHPEGFAAFCGPSKSEVLERLRSHIARHPMQ